MNDKVITIDLTHHELLILLNNLRLQLSNGTDPAEYTELRNKFNSAERQTR